MTIQIKVLLVVIIADVAILALSVAKRWIAPLTPEGRAKLREARFGLRFRDWFVGVAATGFTSYNLYLWYTAEKLMFPTRTVSDAKIVLADHPLLFLVLGVIYSYGLLVFASVLMWSIYETLRLIATRSRLSEK
jgi:hypothetical protein